MWKRRPSQPPLGCRRGSCTCCSVAVSDLCMNGPAPCMLTSYRHRVTAVCFHNVFCECGSRSVQWQSTAVSLSEGCRKCFSWGLNLWWLLNTPHLKWWTKITAGQKFYLRAFAVWGYWSQGADVLQGHGFILALGNKNLDIHLLIPATSFCSNELSSSDHLQQCLISF